jgi:hypothetical protein
MGTVKPLKIDGFLPSDSSALAALRYPLPHLQPHHLGGEKCGKQARRSTRRIYEKEFEKLNADKYGFVSQSRLRKAGWKFKGDELIGEPASAKH